MRFRARSSWLLATLASAAGLAGCAGDGTGPGNGPPANQAPGATISAPQPGAAFASGEAITFVGSATDPEDGQLSGSALVWTSSLVGQIGSGTTFARADLPVGLHAITLTATDAEGRSGQATVSITVNPGPLPDLTPGAIDVQPLSPDATETFTVETSISNLGTSTTEGPVTWRLTLDGQELARGEVPALAPGETVGPIGAADAGPLAAGLHDLELEVDPDGSIEELDEDNNTRAVTINILSAPAPDLAVTSLEVTPAGATENDALTVAAEITNQGVAAAGGTLSWSLVVDDLEVGGGTVPDLGPGESFDVMVGGLGPLQAMAHLAELRLDAEDAIPEADEANNVGAVGFTVSGTGFDIELRFLLPAPVAQTRAFTDAANRWTELITGDIEDFPLDAGGDGCHPPVNQTVDDVILFVVLSRIDGPGGTLGQAGPCFLRDEGFLPLTGIMRFDITDLETLESLDLLEDVILHEMAHVLGFGTI